MRESDIDIVEIRKLYGLRQNKMAELLGTTSSSVSRWESGKTPLPKWARKQYEQLQNKPEQFQSEAT